MTVTNAQAVAVMRAAQLTPLADYPGASAPWPCICDTCGYDGVNWPHRDGANWPHPRTCF